MGIDVSDPAAVAGRRPGDVRGPDRPAPVGHPGRRRGAARRPAGRQQPARSGRAAGPGRGPGRSGPRLGAGRPQAPAARRDRRRRRAGRARPAPHPPAARDRPARRSARCSTATGCGSVTCPDLDAGGRADAGPSTGQRGRRRGRGSVTDQPPSPEPAAAAPRCSVGARLRGDPMAGTAAPAAGFLLLEQPGGWGRQALTSSRLDPAVGRAVSARAIAPGPAGAADPPARAAARARPAGLGGGQLHGPAVRSAGGATSARTTSC